MTTLASIKRAAALLAAALFAACGGSQLKPLGGIAGPAGLVVEKSGAVRSAGDAMRPDRGRSWMLAPNTRCGYDEILPPCGLLYVSNYHNNDVLVFQHDKLVGTLTGLRGPDGVCPDKAGHVWIVNNLGANIVEYAHGGTSPIATLQDPGVYPLGCAVNPITGALAVTNIFTTGSGQGSVAIYHHASGNPLILTDPDIFYVYFCGFDSAGNLFIDGRDTSGGFKFAELPRNKYKFKNITLDQTIYFPGAIQWDRKHIVVGDQRYQNSEASAIYQTTGAGGQVVGTTVFTGARDVVGYWIEATSVIGPDVKLNVVGLYRYPAGGRATVRVHQLDHPYGATVSYVR
jgi:hypothetical protein